MRMRLEIALLALGIFSSAAEAAYTWKSLPVGGGGFVSGVVASRQERNRFYLRTDVGGAYRWNQAKGAWESITDWSIDAGDQGVSSLALDPQNPARLYMVTGISYFNSGRTWLLRSSDYGATFEKVEVTSSFKANGNGGGRHLGERLAVDPNLPTRLLAGSGSSANGAFLSNDRGSTWTAIAGIDRDANASFVAFDSSSSTRGTATKIIYVGLARTGKRNLFRSDDAGATWSVVTGLDTLVPQRGIVAENGSLVVTYADKPVLEQSGKGSIWKRTRAGIATEISPNGSHQAWSGIHAQPGNPDRLIASSINSYGTPQCWVSKTSCGWGSAAWGEVILTSEDGGTTWTNQVAGINNPSKTVKLASEPNGPRWAESANANIHWSGSVVFDPFDPSRAFVTSGQGVFRAAGLNTSAVTWNFSTRGIEELVTNEFFPVPGGTHVSAVWDYDGIRWQNDSTYPDNKFQPGQGHNYTLAVALAAPRFMARFGAGNTASVLVSSDSGKTWTAMPRPVASAGGKVFFNRDASVLLFARESQVFRSTDKGATWGSIAWGAHASPVFVSDPIDPKLIYSYNASTGALLVSLDGGASFTSRGPITSWGNGRLAPVPGRTGEFWLARNGGTTATSEDRLLRYAIDPATGAVALVKGFGPSVGLQVANLVGTGKASPGMTHPALYIWGKANNIVGIHRSTDSGRTWIRVNDDGHQYGGPGNGQFIYGDPDRFGRVYMGTFGRGVVYGDLLDEPSPVSISDRWLSASASSNSLLLSATPDASLGPLVRVEFYVNGALAATRTSAPWTWTIVNPASGNYYAIAKAYGPKGVVSTSAGVAATVKAAYGLMLAPNPWFGLATLTYTLPAGTPAGTTVNFQVVRVGGAGICKDFTDVSTSTGANSIRLLNSKYYPAGTYIVTMYIGGLPVASVRAVKL